MKNQKLTMLLALVAAAAITMSACAAPTAPEASSLPDTTASTPVSSEAPPASLPEQQPVGDSVLTVKGLADGERSYTLEQLMALAPTEASAELKTSAGEVTPITCKGVTLDTLLTDVGSSQKSFGSVVAAAADGYSVELPSEVMQTRDIVIAYEFNGEASALRVVVPQERAMYWVQSLATLELVGGAVEVPTSRVLLLETLAKELTATDYNGTTDKAVAFSALSTAAFAEPSDSVKLVAADGLTKNEKSAIAGEQVVKLTGEFAPMFTGAKLPEGMQVKQVLTITSGNSTVLSYASALGKLGTTKAGDKEGVSVKKLFELIGIADAASYSFEAADGYKTSVAAADLASGVIFVGEDGVQTYFDGLPKNTGVRNLKSITAEG